eukprot:COSAG01_NODE_50891_length_359_cov_1.000000_1_plen_40_part_01
MRTDAQAQVRGAALPLGFEGGLLLEACDSEERPRYWCARW